VTHEGAMSGPTDSDALRHQIVELERQLAECRQRERLLGQILDTIPSAIYATRRDGTLLFVNETFAQQWGQSPADFVGRTLEQAFPAATAAAWKQTIDELIAQDSVSMNRETYGEGEAARHYENLRFPVRDESSAAIGLAGVATDISERVRAEEGYADTRLILEGIVNNSPAVIYVKSPESRLMLVNASYARVVGRPVEDLVGRGEDEIFPAELVARWRESDRDLFASGEPHSSETTFYLDGEPHDFITIQFPLYDRERRPYAICGISTDVTDIRHAERERERLQATIIDAQRAALRELSTPLIPLADDVVVMPLIGSLDSTRVGQVMETLLEGVSRQAARIAILDITGLPLVDSQVANALLQAAQAAKLLGAEVLLTGIGPEVAQTLVGIGADLSGLQTPGTLQAGIAYALRNSR
jgi:rsbT co-antagonist protein RsbR